MTKYSKKLYSFIILNICITFIFSCKCRMPDKKDLSVALKEYSNIFMGTVTLVNLTKGDSGFGEKEVHFSHIANIKGNNDENATYYTQSSSAACGVNFSKGDTWIVYAYAYNDRVSVNSCTWTRLYQNYEDYTISSEVNQLQKLVRQKLY